MGGDDGAAINWPDLLRQPGSQSSFDWPAIYMNILIHTPHSPPSHSPYTQISFSFLLYISLFPLSHSSCVSILLLFMYLIFSSDTYPYVPSFGPFLCPSFCPFLTTHSYVPSFVPLLRVFLRPFSLRPFLMSLPSALS